MDDLPEDVDRDFVAGTLIVDDGELLLMNHSKLGMWLQPGGHVEKGETPEETARRETKEETGIEIEFHPSTVPPESPDDTYNLPEPFRINYHRIREGHWHYSFLYLATVRKEGEATHAGEHDGLKWFGPEELESEKYEIPDNLRQTALEAIRQVEDYG
ncbi:MAG: NUDIX hydrolase [Candidatus Nanohaloarchaea archaeon]